MVLEDLTNLTEDEKKILRTLRSKHLTPEELKTILNQKDQKPRKKRTYRYKGTNVKYLVISDSHIGNRCYDPDLMEFAAEMAHKHKVDFVAHAGDICDGLYRNRPGHVFELEHIGADEQIKAAVKELSQFELPLYFITGNHTWNTFYQNAGLDIGTHLEDKIKDSCYLGNADGTIELDHGIKLQFLHPDGGSSYAISYKSQKIIESLQGGTKPHVLHIGHFHKLEYLFYRNIHCFQTGCLEDQTDFMRKKGLSAHKGFYIVTLKINKGGIASIKPELFPAYK